MASYLYGIKGIKFGTPTGTASMPLAAALETWAQTVEGSFTISEAEATTKDFKVEETTVPILTIVSEAGNMTLTWRAYNCDPSVIAKVKGGTPTPETKWVAPSTAPSVFLAIEVETTDGAKINIYKAAIFARFDGNVTRGDILQMEVKATVQDPGDGGSPFDITIPAG